MVYYLTSSFPSLSALSKREILEKDQKQVTHGNQTVVMSSISTSLQVSSKSEFLVPKPMEILGARKQLKCLVPKPKKKLDAKTNQIAQCQIQQNSFTIFSSHTEFYNNLACINDLY